MSDKWRISPEYSKYVDARIRASQTHLGDALIYVNPARIEVFNTIKINGREKEKDVGENYKLNIATKSIKYIMDLDKNCRDINKTVQARKIATIALDVGVPPEVIGAIIKQETHFSTDSADMNKGQGVGPMQLTSITLQDMFIRPEVYDSSIKNFVGPKKKYKSFAEALRAKADNEDIDLGKFGNKFFEFYKKNREYFDKYKGVYNNAPKALREKYTKSLSNYDLNVYLGCWLYKMRSKNKSEKQAIISYNNSPSRYAYERAVSDTIRHVRKNIPEIITINS